MRTLKSEIFFLMVFFISGIQNELRPGAENVCLQSETYEETIIEKVKKPVREYVKTRCGGLFKRSCIKKVLNWKVVDEPRVVQKTRAVLKCCSGYKEIAARCVPMCSEGCVHGECTAPDQCTSVPGFCGPACSMSSDVTKAKTNSVEKSTTKDIFQTTEKSELKNPTLTSKILKITDRDFMTETTGEVKLGMAETTVTKTETSSYERSTTELDEKELSEEKFENGKFTIAVDLELSLPTLLTASTEEGGMNAKYSNLKEAVGLENGVPHFSEGLSTEGNEMQSNTRPILEFEEHNTLEPMVRLEISGKNLQAYDFTFLFYALPVSCFVLAIALWIVVKRRKKIKESQTENQHPFYSKDFCAEDPFWSKLFRNHSESPIGMSEVEPNSIQPILLGFSKRSRSESPINMWEAGPNSAKPPLKDLQDCDRSHAVHSEGTFI